MEYPGDDTTAYSDSVDKRLRPVSGGLSAVLDLFAGAGGLALGFESIGFDTEGYERDLDCVRTYESNLSGDLPPIALPLIISDL
jgi:DNA (cytosine-5)-methyltransferase 1